MSGRRLHRRTHVKPDGRALHLYGWRPHTGEPTTDIEPVPAPRPHIRWHPFRREWVTYAPNRQARTFKPPPQYCPLCPTAPGGFASEIPFADFDVAVFDNRFPAFHADPPAPPALAVPTGAASGACEVLVYSSAHTGSLAALPQARRELLVEVWAERYRALLARDDVAFVLPFENKGEEVGVTLHHPHGQIYAFPFVPPVQAAAAATFREGPALARLLQAMGDAYTVAERPGMIAFVPPFARFPYEVWIAPLRPLPGPWAFKGSEAADFAVLLGEVVARYDKLWDKPFPYILSLQAAPKGEEKTFHFHAEFYPPLRTATKLKHLAGVEQAAGAFLMDALPEETAAELRGLAPVKTAFERAFGARPEAMGRAHGRANLLGEHTDYNGGFVLPTPLAYLTTVEIARREGAGGTVEAYAAQFDETRSRAISAPREGNWLDYVVGCLKVLAEEGHAVPALRVAIDGSVPMGAGISSSAALEVAMLRATRSLLGLAIDDVDLALLGQRAENSYVGMQCGTMDQMVASLGAPGKALFLDTRDNRTALIDLPAGHRIAVIHCGVGHRLTASGYNTRREECNRAARALGVALLREVGVGDLARIQALAPPLDRRARHVVTENARVLAGVDALRRGEAATFGRLMDESHASQRDDYEVSIPEIDALVDSAQRHGAVGARLTGGGFGGSIVALVAEGAFDAWLARVLADRPAARLL